MGPHDQLIPLRSGAMTQAPLVPNPKAEPKHHVCAGVSNPKAEAQAPRVRCGVPNPKAGAQTSCVRRVCEHLSIPRAPRGRMEVCLAPT